MIKNLVSIICPCYNSAMYVQRMLDSVARQTYNKIELIIVDDGSTDDTVNIVKNNMLIFEKCGMKLICLKQKHNGQASAVNKALKILKGEFFVLIDSDDFFLPTAIEKRVNILKNNKEYGVVVSDCNIVREDNLNHVLGRGHEKLGWFPFQKNQFELLVSGLSIVGGIGYMIRTAYMKRINPQMEINRCIEGQNYQLLLPMYYHYKRYYIDEPLLVYVVRDNSHDHMKRNKWEKIQRGENLIMMLEEVLSDMQLDNKEIKKYIKLSSFNRLVEEA